MFPLGKFIHTIRGCYMKFNSNVNCISAYSFINAIRKIAKRQNFDTKSVTISSNTNNVENCSDVVLCLCRTNGKIIVILIATHYII